MADRFVKGSTYRLYFAITKKQVDGTYVAWDLNATPATVQLFFRRPDGTIDAPVTATLEAGAGGTAYYDTPAAHFDPWAAAYGSFSVRVTDGAVIQESEPYLFYVVNSP